MVEQFNLRVYGLLIHENKVLVTDEYRAGMIMTKFPGGGLEKGEGLADCLIREFQEELEIQIEMGNFYYVNDFLQLSAFDPKDQLLSFYYCVKTAALHKIPYPLPINGLNAGDQSFRWVKLQELDVTSFSFPIDRIVAGNLKLGIKKPCL